MPDKQNHLWHVVKICRDLVSVIQCLTINFVFNFEFHCFQDFYDLFFCRQIAELRINLKRRMLEPHCDHSFVVSGVGGTEDMV